MGLKSQSVFERHEKKYILTPRQYSEISEDMSRYMAGDQYGLHTICSIYYDTDDYKIVRHSISKPSFKEKLRLRSYGIPKMDDTVFLELKKKLSGVTYKRRIPIVLKEAEQYLHHRISPKSTGQIFSEIDWFMNENRPGPKVMICYDRIALFDEMNPDLRITFDAGIRWRDHTLSLAKGDYGTQLLLSGQRLMEIKIAGNYPCWLSQMLAKHKCFPTSFSKYGNIYQNHLCKEAIRSVG